MNHFWPKCWAQPCYLTDPGERSTLSAGPVELVDWEYAYRSPPNGKLMMGKVMSMANTYRMILFFDLQNLIWNFIIILRNICIYLSLCNCLSFPKYLSGMNSGSRTNKNKNKLTGKYMNKNDIASEYVSIVIRIRLPDQFLIKPWTVLSTNSRCPFA